jgi:hypothetical protein
MHFVTLSLLLTNVTVQGLTLKICDFGTACDKATIMTNNKVVATKRFKSLKHTFKFRLISLNIPHQSSRKLPFYFPKIEL